MDHGRVAGPGRKPAQRVLILGLDGATWDVLNPLMAEGHMPRLKEVVTRGASGILQSTVPPITPAAWTTFLTGRKPGAHGIIDFERYDPASHKLSFNSTFCLDHVRTLWQILGEKGLKVGSVNVPMTYPARPLNGFLISGFETPGPQSAFVYPPQLKDEVLRRFPDPTLRSNWRRKTAGGVGVFQQNLDYIARSFHQGASMTTWLADSHGWDVLMVVFKLLDNLQHKTWKYIDPRWAGRDPLREGLVKRCFAEADTAIGTLLDYAKNAEAAVLIVSDHGHGSLEGKVQPNLLLQRWGYLALRSSVSQKWTRARFLWDRLRGRTRRFVRPGDVLHDLAVDFSGTRACVMHAGMAGFVYINLRGRQPAGIVEPAEYEVLRDELRDRFLACHTVTPQGRTAPLFTAAHKPEELYGCPREEQPWMPDLMLIPFESLAVVRKIRGRSPVRWLSYAKLEGTHRSEGVLAAVGPGVAKQQQLSANIADCAPTILAMLGLPVPRDMQGRVIAELFDHPPAIGFESAPMPPRATERPDVYTERELQAVTTRLSELGYLE
jgi:predicted AlkP superfamily phosphohydrolase/phosphomutase